MRPCHCLDVRGNMETVGKGLAERDAYWKAKRNELAYERLILSKRLDMIDRDMAKVEAALQADEDTAKDNRTEIVVAEAKAQATKPPASVSGAETGHKE